MASFVTDSSIRKLYGETVSLTTTASHLLFRPNYHEVKMVCASDWRLGIAPRLASVKYYNASTYTSYLSQATDRVSTTHVPLDGMLATHKLYMGFTAPVRGFYLNVDTNVNAVDPSTLDMEYLYDVSDHRFKKLTGTVSAAFTVGETVIGGTSGATATHVYDDGSTYIIVKDISGTFALAETVSGAAQTCATLTAIDYVGTGTGYFTDVANDSDGTKTGTVTLAKAGLYAFDLPAVVQGGLAGIDLSPLYWYRFAPSTTISATIDVVDIIPACDTVNYGYMEAGVIQQFSLNLAQNGAFEFDHTSSGTLNVTFIQH